MFKCISLSRTIERFYNLLFIGTWLVHIGIQAEIRINTQKGLRMNTILLDLCVHAYKNAYVCARVRTHTCVSARADV